MTLMVCVCAQVLYIFVTIAIDVDHLIATVQKNFPPRSRVALLGTIQFSKVHPPPAHAPRAGARRSRMPPPLCSLLSSCAARLSLGRG